MPVGVSWRSLDIDFFKRVNDTWGHQVGDEALKATASFVQRTVRAVDRVYGFGGEEFAVLDLDVDAIGAANGVVDAADCSLYQAKHLGRNRVVMSDTATPFTRPPAPRQRKSA